VSGPLLEVRRLTKHFVVHKGVIVRRAVGKVHAVDDVSFEIAEGRTYAIVGESGCGKTTTARLILRLEEPTAGAVFVEGKNVHGLVGDDLRRYRMSVQAVFQDPWGSLNPRLRVRDTVAEPLVVNQKLGKKELAERVEAVMLDVGLQPRQADLYPHEFSGGQRQRIALAAALIANPKLIVLDEPVSALDVSVQAQVMNLLKELQAEHGLSYLLVAHNLATVRYLAWRIGVMYLGEIMEEAPTEELFQEPRHPYTRALLASALPTHPAARRDEVPIEGEVPNPIDPPPGCRFRQRCPYAMARCAEEAPARREVAPGHVVSCHLY
jgi:oligopeptide/dipeptide ABC transporter ATP-binding protein